MKSTRRRNASDSIPQASSGLKSLGGAYRNKIHRIEHPPTGSFFRIDYSIGHMTDGYVLDYWPKTIEGPPGFWRIEDRD